MKTSSNYGLKLMEGTDNVKRQDFVDNFTKIDSTMKSIADSGFPLVNAIGTNAYTGTNTDIKSLTKGITKFTLFVGTDATGNCSLNLNSWGVKNIKDSNGNIVDNLKKDIPYNVCYNGTDFILQGKGGGGNVQASEVLNGKTFTNDKGSGIGTMPSINNPITNLNCGGSYTIPKGYHPGTEKVNANSLASQTQGTAGPEDILSGKTAIVNGNKITGTIPIKNGGNDVANTYIGFNGTNLLLAPPSGTYFNGASVTASASQIANVLGITSNMIVSGNNILGINGTAETRTFTVGSVNVPGKTGYNITVNLGYQPNFVLVFQAPYAFNIKYIWFIAYYKDGNWVSTCTYNPGSYYGTINRNSNGFSITGTTVSFNSAYNLAYICG